MDYARRGWAVFPVHSAILRRDLNEWRCSCGHEGCRSPAKHPIPYDGLKVATTDTNLIRAWFTRWPYANIGIRTGAVSSLAVLDVDPKHGGFDSLEDLRHKVDLPETVEVITGSNGRHIYFKTNGQQVRNSVGKLGPGLDVRGEGGYVVAPGSRHISGGVYDWEASSSPDQVAIADVPLALVSNKADESVRTDDIQSVGLVVASGGRNAYLTSLAGVMRDRGMGLKAIGYALWYENLEKCSPPLEPEEVKSIARSICRYAPKRVFVP